MHDKKPTPQDDGPTTQKPGNIESPPRVTPPRQDGNIEPPPRTVPDKPATE